MNRELPDVQAGFRKGRGTRDLIAKIVGSSKKQENTRKSIYSCFIDYAKVFDYWSQAVENSSREEYKTTSPASWEICMQANKQKLEPDIV